ncbi:Gfo/Idh/MocA family oxidoreductase [Mucilaginibacter daejeonensis]|uniref:Gfo/Idh/MocA family protein n=1 Tax=Mucilaginibacter daejeonensis TaxID=398049 RepID=UPI001D1788AD|nr:Gfo/Idh/MocA family oxidoreductase [Mucilaginibacter daejeonensis]UEG54209.1 Gfo/Idh/MocA family oxidoreductase [Mucilaginibacter daejeonensis]
MNDQHLPGSTLTEQAKGFGRRDFISMTGKGLVAATVASTIPPAAATAQSRTATGPHGTLADVISVDVPSQHAPSERKQETGTKMIPPDKRIGYAIVGIGELTMGQIMPGFGSCKYSKPVALVSSHPDKARKVAAQYGIPEKNIYNYQNFDDIKNNPDIDAVYIVLPNSMHHEFVIRSAKAGKHVLCEKPMANSSKEAQEMIDACKKAGKKLMIAYRIQYEPNNKLIKDLVRNKTHGQVKVIDSVNVQNIGDPQQWRLKKALAGGGSLPDIGLYCINTNRYLTGEEPYMVNATTHSDADDPRFKEVEDKVMFQMFFPSGTIANNTTAYSVHDSKHYRCYAANGGWFGMDPAFNYNGLKIELSKAEGSQEIKQQIIVGEKQQFALEMDHFAECIMENKDPYTPGEEGLQDQKIMEAIYASARSGKPVMLNKVTTVDTFRNAGNAPKYS